MAQNKVNHCPGCHRSLSEIKRDGCGSQRCPPNIRKADCECQIEKRKIVYTLPKR